ncbi:MAG TPA: hypothetical protein VLG44_08070 [Chlamydiales bacterium]|nr:hypothetical protein [Chlamydiales bacterium]
MKKTALLLLIATAVLFLTGERIILFSANLFLKFTFAGEFVSKFSSDKSSFSKGKLLWEGVKIAHGKYETIEIEKASVQPFFKGFSLIPSFKICIEDPQIHLGQETLSSFFLENKKKFPNCEIEVKNGKVFLESREVVQFSIVQELKDYHLDFTLDQLQLDEIAFLFPTVPTLEGSVSGKIQVQTESGVFKEGKIDCEVFDLKIFKNNRKISVKNVEIKSNLLEKEFAPPLFAFLFGERFFPAHFRMHFEGGEIESETVKISSLQGFISHESSLGLKTEITGIVGENASSAFLWEGKGYFTSSFQNWLETSVTFKGDKESSFFLQAEEIDKELAEVNVSAENMPSQIGSFFLSLLGDRFAEIEKLEWKQGSLSFASIFHFNKRKLTSFETISLEGTNLIFFDPVRKVTFQTAFLDAKGECFLDEIFKSSLELYLEGGVATLEKEKIEVKDLFGSIKYAHQKFLSSYMELILNDRSIQMHLDGPIGGCWLSLHMQDQPEELYLDVILSNKGHWEIAGSAQIERDKFLLDEWDFLLSWQGRYPEGWATGKKIQLDRFPFTFREEKISCKGRGEIDAKFTGSHVKLSFSGRDLKLASSLFTWNFPEIKKETFSFDYDLEKKTVDLSFTFQNALGKLPQLGLDFDDIQGQFLMKNDLLTLQIEKMKSEGLKMGGEIIIDTAKESLVLCSNYLEGSIDSGKKFFRHFKKSFFTTLPMNGNLRSPMNGFYFSMLKEEDPLWGLTLMLEEGRMALGPISKLHDFQGILHWDSTDTSLHMYEAIGMFSLGQDKCILSFPFFEMKDEKTCEFDLRLSRPSWDVLVLKGSFVTEEVGEEHANLTFSFTPDCRFFGAPLEIPTLVTFDLDEIKQIELKTLCSLPSLLLCAEFMNKMGNIFPELPKFEGGTRGKMDLSLRYGFPDSHITLKGKDIFLFESEVQTMGLTARFGKDSLLVEKCFFDDLSLSFSVENGLSLSNVEAKWKDALLVTGHAQYLGDKKFDCNMQSFTLQLKEIEEFQKEFFPISPLAGSVSGNGHLSLQWEEGKPKWEADLDIHIKDLKYREFPITNLDQMHLFHSSDTGLMALGMHFDIDSKTVCKIGLLSQEKPLGKWRVSDFSLELQQNLNDFVKNLNFELPPQINTFLSTFSSVHLQGSAAFANDLSSIEISLPELSLSTFENERFSYLTKKMNHLSKVSLYYTKNHLLLSSSFPEINEKFQGILSFNTSSDFGKLFLLEENQSSFPLTLYWNWDEKGFKVSQIEGEFSGVDASFYTDVEGSLKGGVKIDFSKACRLFPETVSTLLSKYKLGDGYELKGTFSWPPDRFQGLFLGKNFEALGCQLKTFLGELDFSSEHLTLKDFRVSDAALTLSMPSFKIKKDKGEKFKAFLPHLEIEEFRPSLLKRLGEKPKEVEPFVIRKLILDDVRGNIDNAKSFSGKGNFNFINSFKREYTVFDVPSDVLGRLFGLDLELLVPVEGVMEYILKDGKLQFTSLKNCYSENKRSKFFLLDKETPYLDLDGNINLNIKMKQYVLFKFTEQFILSIGGNLADPTFQLKRKKSFFPDIGL